MHVFSLVRTIGVRCLMAVFLITSAPVCADRCADGEPVQASCVETQNKDVASVSGTAVEVAQPSSASKVVKFFRGVLQLGVSAVGLGAILDALLDRKAPVVARCVQGGLGVFAVAMAGLMFYDDGVYVAPTTPVCDECCNPLCHCHTYSLLNIPVCYHEFQYPDTHNEE